MVKAKNGRNVVGSYKTIREAAEAMVAEGSSVSVNSAMVNISNAIAGSEPRKRVNTRETAYGLKWSVTASKKSAKTSKKSR